MPGACITPAVRSYQLGTVKLNPISHINFDPIESASGSRQRWRRDTDTTHNSHSPSSANIGVVGNADCSEPVLHDYIFLSAAPPPAGPPPPLSPRRRRCEAAGRPPPARPISPHLCWPAKLSATAAQRSTVSIPTTPPTHLYQDGATSALTSPVHHLKILPQLQHGCIVVLNLPAALLTIILIWVA